MVADGEEGKQYDGILKGTPTFSPDSKRVAYGAVVGDKSLVVVDGEEGKQYDGILGDTRVVFDSPNTLHYLALIGRGFYLVEEEMK